MEPISGGTPVRRPQRLRSEKEKGGAPHTVRGFQPGIRVVNVGRPTRSNNFWQRGLSRNPSMLGSK